MAAGANPVSLLSVEDAIGRIVSGATPLPSEPTPIDLAGGRTLAETLAATRTQPPFPASAMDGYALRADDTKPGNRLPVHGVSAAGHGFHGDLDPGACIRIFTGAPVPRGADTILIQENARAEGEIIEVLEAAPPGRHIRAAGLDFSEGDELLETGTVLVPRALSLAAAMGYGVLPVLRQPRVAVFSTGDELVPPGTTPGPDQIVSSNAVGTTEIVRSSGGVARDMGIASDSPESISAILDRAAAFEADIIVSLGGASVGDHDLVRPVLESHGMELDFWRVAMRPGKPLMFGRLGDRCVLGLPGNPVSAFVCALLFLRPLIQAYLGQAIANPEEDAILATDTGANDRRQDYIRSRFTISGGRLLVTPFTLQDSAMQSTLASANCLLVRPPHAPATKAGSPCRIIRLP